jgi:hypothetical protein
VEPTVPVDPTEPVEPTGTVEPTEPVEPTESPDPTETTAPTTAPLPTPIDKIDVDIEIEDNSDHSIRYTYNDNSTFIVEGNRYSNTYVYTYDGVTYRGYNCGCWDFGTQRDAQAVFDATGRSLYWLDSDNDGLACERELGEFTYDYVADTSSGTRRGGQVSIYPLAGIATGQV